MDTQKEKVYLLSESMLLARDKMQREKCASDLAKKWDISNEAFELIRNAPSPDLPLPIEIPSDEEIEKAGKEYSNLVHPHIKEESMRIHREAAELDLIAGIKWMRDKILSKIK